MTGLGTVDFNKQEDRFELALFLSNTVIQISIWKLANRSWSETDQSSEVVDDMN